jgi:hypothetical protein
LLAKPVTPDSFITLSPFRTKMNQPLYLTLSLAVSLTLPVHAELWTNALGNNDFGDWRNWVVDGTTTLPTTWVSSTQNWQVNSVGADRAVVGPGQTVSGVDRNVLVGDAESSVVAGGPNGQSGELLVDGGTLSITRNLRIGRDSVTGTGVVTVASGGVINTGYGLFVGQGPNAGSHLNLIDGTINVTTNSSRTDGLRVAHFAGGDGTITVSGGSFNVQRGNALFGEGSNNLQPAKATLNLAGGGRFIVAAGNVGFGGNAGGVDAALTIADDAELQAANGRFGFGANSTVSFVMTSGKLTIPSGYLTFGQAAEAVVTVSVSGGLIQTDRMVWGNHETAIATLAMTGGTFSIVRSVDSTSSNTGGLILGAGASTLDVDGDAVITAEKLRFTAGGLIRLGGAARLAVSGSTDGANATLGMTVASIQAGEVLGRLVFNGGTFTIAGAGETYPDPTPESTATITVDYAEVLNAAIGAGVIYTEQADATLVAQYDPTADITHLVLVAEQAPTTIWAAYDAVDGWKMTGSGLLVDAAYPVVFLHGTGWLTIDPQASSLDGFYAFSHAAGHWLWSADSIGGWCYNFEATGWQTW